MRIIIFLKYFFTAVMIISVSIPAISQAERAAAEIQELMKQDVVGLSVAVVKGKKIVYSRAFGMKDLESKTVLQEKDLFRIDSITKSFSATSIMQLVGAGKLSLTDDFSNLIGFKVRNPKFAET